MDVYRKVMVYSICKVYLKWLKKRLVDRLMVCAVKHVNAHLVLTIMHFNACLHCLPYSFGDEYAIYEKL